MKALTLSLLLLLPASLPLRQIVAGFVHLPTAVERWLYNPRERTSQGLDAYRKGKVDSALQKFEGARRLAPKDPSVLFNAGTAHLAAHDGKGAVKLLEKAIKSAPRALLPRAQYNLGNAWLASGNPAAAVSAYEKSLLSDPSQPDAKYNLELALRELKKKREADSRRNQSEASKEQRPNGSQDGHSTGNQRPPEGQRQARSQDNAANERQRESKRGEPEPKQRSPRSSSVLPQFAAQPNMSAAQAAAILKAVENLERQQRRQAALKRARHRATTEKDW
ncbi:MAG TPA: tetratricopeptide repeat protein [Thermoanaerobaculia bacterium]|nr:tetratricopeptide repeat protein [Thermoanaerobaculia bacterium]